MIPNYFKWFPHHFKWYFAIAMGVLFIVGGLRRWRWINTFTVGVRIYGLAADPRVRTLVLIVMGISMILIGSLGIWLFP
jgi:hypothetical protein